MCAVHHLLPTLLCSHGSRVSQVNYRLWLVCISQLIPSVLQGSQLSLMHHSLNYGKPLVSRLETCKFFVASCLAYKAECAGFYAQLNIDDGSCYSWWMSFIIRWCHCLRLLMRVVNQALPLCTALIPGISYLPVRADLHTTVPLEEAWITINVVDVAEKKSSKFTVAHYFCCFSWQSK